MTRTAGAYDDASADDLSFVLGPTAAPTSGAADPAFAGGGNVSLAFASQSVAVGADGQVLLAGAGSGGAGGSTSAVLERLKADGSADPTFGTGGTVSDEVDAAESFYGVVPEADGGAVAVGSDGGSILLARYLANGSPDAAFGTNGRAVVAAPGASDAAAYGVALDPAGNIVVGGSAGGQFLADRFTPTGAQDPAFNGGRRCCSAPRPTWTRWAGWRCKATAASSPPAPAPGRSSSCGSPRAAPDPAFGTGGVLPVAGLAAPAPSAGQADHSEGLAIDPAGNLLVANTTAGGDFGLARLTPGGAADTSFGPSGLATADFGGADDADFVAVRPDGAQVLVAGTTTAGGAGGNQIGVAAFTTAGQPDATFAGGGREVLDSGLAAASAAASEARPAAGQPAPRAAPGSAAGPDAEGIGEIVQQVFGTVQPDGKLLVGAAQQGGSARGATVRRVLTAAATPAPTALPAGTLKASVAASLPKSAIAGAKLDARATVTLNNPTGATISGPVTVTIDVSPASSLDGATELTAVTKKISLKAGKSAKVALKVSTLPSVPDGTYFLLASVKAPDNSVTGAAGPSLSVAAPLVAARVSAVRPLPASVAAGRKGGVSLTVTNGGNTAAAGTATLTVLASPAGGSGAVTLVATPLKVKLKPGAGKAYRVKFTLPSSLAAGSYDLTASLAVGALGDTTASDGTSAGTSPLVVT